MINTESIALLSWSEYFDEVPQRIQKIPGGFRNESFLIEVNDKTSYVLKIYAHAFLTDEKIASICSLVEKLLLQNAPVFELIKGKNGSYLQKVERDGIIYQTTLSKYIPTTIFKESHLTQEILSEVATQLALLHTKLKKLDDKKAISKLNFIKKIESCIDEKTVELIKATLDQDKYLKGRANEIINVYKKEGEFLKNYFVENKKRFDNNQLIHGDFNLSNLNVVDNKIVTIFDFDAVTIAPITYDIGCSIVHLDEGFFLIEDLMDGFLRTYTQQKVFSHEDINDVYCFMRLRPYYRFSRWFTYYSQTKNPGKHFSYYFDKILKYKNIEINRVVNNLTKKQSDF